MNKKCSLIAVALVMSATSALGHQWEQIGTHETSTYLFINPKTFSASGDGTVKTWTKREFDVDKTKMEKEKLPPEMYKGKKSHVAYEEYDCIRQKKRIFTGMTYDNEQGTQKDQEKTDWAEVQAGAEKGLFDAVCRKAKSDK